MSEVYSIGAVMSLAFWLGALSGLESRLLRFFIAILFSAIWFVSIPALIGYLTYENNLIEE